MAIRVLLVEDNPGDARLVREALAEASSGQFELTHVDRFSAASKRLAQGEIDVVLLDLLLPDRKGLYTFTMLNRLVPEVPIVVLTGLDDEALGVEAVRAGAQDYLTKGQMDGNLLARSMRYAIERHRTELERQRLALELKEALAEIHLLSGLLPICCYCKKVRDDARYWKEVETYIAEHAELTQNICSECAHKLYTNILIIPASPPEEPR